MVRERGDREAAERLVVIGSAREAERWCREQRVNPQSVIRVFERGDERRLMGLSARHVQVVTLEDPHPEVAAYLTQWALRDGAPRGLFIAFEGCEGSGKSTQVRALAEAMRRAAVDVVTTREPGATRLGKTIRALLLDGVYVDPPSDRAEALLYAADRAHHVATVVAPALARGTTVITDRYVDSSLAYQGAGRDLDDEQVRWLSEFATDGLKPDLTVVLDVPAEVGLARAQRRGETDRLESEPVVFHTRVRRRYLSLARANPYRYVVIDGLVPPDLIAAQVADEVFRRLANRRGESAGEVRAKARMT